ncbi:MAG: restriction endonuclease subunit S [Treponema sp.]|nr:restriction endonuclease subunit S [Treponema sp.]
MEYKKLGDYCNITSSKRIFAEQYVTEGIPFYRSKEIIEKNNNQNISESLFISKETYETIKEKYGVPEENDILLTSVGTLGVPYIVKNETFYFKDGNLTWFKNFKKELNQKYLYYWLSSKFGYKSLILKAIGSSQSALTIDILKKYKLLIPPLPTQQKIASILSAYDNLIQNYKKQIEALQTAASELYKEWFVRFRFPGYQTTKFENGIPEGWKIEKLFDVAKIIYGYPFNSDEFCDDNSLNPVVRIRDILDNHTDTYTSESCDEKYWINPNEMLIGMDGIFHMTLWTGERALQNQRTVRVTSKIKNLSNYYLYFSLYPQIKALEQMIVGTTVAHLGDKHLKKITILVPAEKLLKMSYERLEPMMNRIYSLQQQITNLTQQRDLLLPRLMSGKLKVE